MIRKSPRQAKREEHLAGILQGKLDNIIRAFEFPFDTASARQQSVHHQETPAIVMRLLPERG
jgi:hypothetical protein